MALSQSPGRRSRVARLQAERGRRRPLPQRRRIGSGWPRPLSFLFFLDFFFAFFLFSFSLPSFPV